MSKKLLLFHVLNLGLILGCNTSADNFTTKNADAVSKDSTLVENDSANFVSSDTIQTTSKSAENFMDVSNWKIDDFIIHKKDKSNLALRNLIEYEKENWRAVKNPFKAKYQGCDFGDYFHLNFKDDEGKYYDFGFGENNLGMFQLYDTVTFEDNSKYMGKNFTIFWNWKICKFPCCDGEYEPVEAYLPSIVRLELE